MNKKSIIITITIISLILSLPSVLSTDSDNDGLDDDNESWVAEWYNCSNTKIRLNVTSDPSKADTDGDTLNDFEERVWNLNPRNIDTDGDNAQEGNEIYSFIDDCPKHCNNFCLPHNENYWKNIVCHQSDPYVYQMIDDYLFKINHLSYVFNKQDTQKANFIFGLYSQWKYNDTNTNFSDNWKNSNFNDSNWSSGYAYLGYNESLITTILDYGPDHNNKTITYYFRKYFNITNASSINNLELNVDFDDGFVAFLNGQEITRSQGASTDHFSYVPYHESSIGDLPHNWHTYNLNSTEINYLEDGKNVLAIEVHQCTAYSSDIVLGAYLVNYKNISSSSLLDNLSDMCHILNTTGTPKQNILQELLTLWLNVVSSELCYKEEITCSSLEANTVDALIGLAENSLINNQTSQYQNISQKINRLNNAQCLGCITCTPPADLNITLLPDNQTIFLDWPASQADYYNLYYSTNASALPHYNIGDSLPNSIKKITNINSTNFTDYNATQNQTMFYRVSASQNSSECLGDVVKAKHTFILYGNTSSQSSYYRSNWISLPLNTTLKAKTNILDKCHGGRALRLHRLDRINNTHYFFTSQEFDIGDPDFTLRPGTGYNIEVASNCNITIVGGLIKDSLKKTLYGSDFQAKFNPYYRTNWFSANFLPGSNYNTSYFLNNISNNAGIRIYTLQRNHSNHYFFRTYQPGSPDFKLQFGQGYAVEVNSTSSITLK